MRVFANVSDLWPAYPLNRTWEGKRKLTEKQANTKKLSSLASAKNQI